MSKISLPGPFSKVYRIDEQYATKMNSRSVSLIRLWKLVRRFIRPESAILIDRYDETLDELLYACQEECWTLRSCILDEVIDRYDQDCIGTLRQNGIFHNDLTSDKIFFSYTGRIVIANYDLSRLTWDERLFQRMRTGIKQI